MFDRLFRAFIGISTLGLLMMCQAGHAAGQDPQRTYESPQAAIEDMLAALKDYDTDTMLAIFGHKHAEDIIGTDKTAARIAGEKAYEAAQEVYALREDGPDSRVLVIGQKAWPFPIPLIKSDGRWRFDTDAGIEEVINRRIGRNELSAIDVCGAYIDAQRLYASTDRDDDGVREYAQRLASTPGMKDGLYWESDSADAGELSPFGPLVAAAWDYLEDRQSSDPFKGYHFRILTRQGENPPGGRYDYVINGNMIAGFALLAHPAEWGHSGIMTFVCSHHGKVLEKDLGADTLEAVKAIQAFDPDDSWQEVVKSE